MLEQQLYCAVCKVPLYDENDEGHFAAIRRGYFHEAGSEGDNDHVMPFYEQD